MAEKSMLWDTGTSGDGAATYTQAETTRMFGMLMSDGGVGTPGTTQGVIPRSTQLAVSAGAGQVVVAGGAAFVAGFFYWNDASLNVAIPTPAAATRIDRIVLRATYGTTRTVRVTRIAGTEGAGAPAIVQTANTTWDIPLAQVSITTGGTITVTDQRVFVHFATKVDSGMLDSGVAVANIGYTPLNKAGDTATGPINLDTTATLGTTAGSELVIEDLKHTQNSGASQLQTIFRRIVNGTTWTSIAQILRRQGATLPGSPTTGAFISLYGDNVGINKVNPNYALEITGQMGISPSSAQPPFVLGVNGQGQLVTGLRADTAASADNAAKLNGDAVRRGSGSWSGSAASSGTINVTFSSPLALPPTVICNAVGTLPSTQSTPVVIGVAGSTANGFGVSWWTANGSSVVSVVLSYIAIGGA